MEHTSVPFASNVRSKSARVPGWGCSESRLAPLYHPMKLRFYKALCGQQTTLWNENAVMAGWNRVPRLSINHIPSYFSRSIIAHYARLAFVCSAILPTFFFFFLKRNMRARSFPFHRPFNCVDWKHVNLLQYRLACHRRDSGPMKNFQRATYHLALGVFVKYWMSYWQMGLGWWLLATPPNPWSHFLPPAIKILWKIWIWWVSLNTMPIKPVFANVWTLSFFATLKHHRWSDDEQRRC